MKRVELKAHLVSDYVFGDKFEDYNIMLVVIDANNQILDVLLSPVVKKTFSEVLENANLSYSLPKVGKKEMNALFQKAVDLIEQSVEASK